MRYRKYLWCFSILFIFFSSTMAESANTRPARIFGTVTVDGAVLTQDTDDGYTFEVTREDGTSYVPAGSIFLVDMFYIFRFMTQMSNQKEQIRAIQP